MKRLLFYIVMTLFFCVGCASTVRTTNNSNLPPALSSEQVYVFQLGDAIPPNTIQIGSVSIGDSGFSVNCGFEQVIGLARNEARKIGGNAIQIVSLRPPDIISTCYRLDANILRIDTAYIPQTPDLSQNIKSSGTAFAINNHGYILTNFHIIENYKEYNILGINGNFNIKYSAELIVSNQVNDLAILKIKEDIIIGNIPYRFINNILEVGENVFALGFPLRATMGDEIKLTNGIISANSGFAGDITSYQVSVPVQPGNSGGPLFDEKGNIVGIINARHIGAENVSYAIKIPYLFNMIQVSNQNIVLNTENTIQDKRLSEQVREIRNYVYIIEASN